MQPSSIFAALSTLIALYAGVPYIKSILNKKTRPHILGWLVWSLMNFVVFFSQFLEGGRESIILNFIFLLFSTTNFILSLKYGIKESSKFDRFLFASSLLTIVLWYITKDNLLAILLTIVIDLLATTMTLNKVRLHPYSEDPFPWFLVGCAYVFALLTLVGEPIGILFIRPIYGVFINFALVGFIYYFNKKRTDLR